MQWPRGKVLGEVVVDQRPDLHPRAEAGFRYLAADGPPAGRTTTCPLFRRAEHQERGSNEFHGTGGPLAVSDMRARATSRTTPLSPRLSGSRLQARPRFQRRRARRRRHLPAHRAQPCGVPAPPSPICGPAMKRPNLKVEIRALAQRVIFDGKRAIEPGRIHAGRRGSSRARARREGIARRRLAAIAAT